MFVNINLSAFVYNVFCLLFFKNKLLIKFVQRFILNTKNTFVDYALEFRYLRKLYIEGRGNTCVFV